MFLLALRRALGPLDACGRAPSVLSSALRARGGWEPSLWVSLRPPPEPIVAVRLTPRHRSFRSGDAYVKPSSEADATAVLAMSGRELGARVVRVRKARPGEADWAATNFAHPPNGDYAGDVRMRGVPHDADEVSFFF